MLDVGVRAAAAAGTGGPDQRAVGIDVVTVTPVGEQPHARLAAGRKPESNGGSPGRDHERTSTRWTVTLATCRPPWAMYSTAQQVELVGTSWLTAQLVADGLEGAARRSAITALT